MAFKMGGFNAGQGTGMSGSPNKLDMGSSKRVKKATRTVKTKFPAEADPAGAAPTRRLNIGGKEYGENESPNQRAKVLIEGGKKGIGYLDDAWKWIRGKKTPKVNTKPNVPVTTPTGPKINISDLAAKLPKGTSSSLTNKAFKLLMTGWAIGDIISWVKGGGDDKGGDDAAIQNEIDNQTDNATDKGAEIGGKTPPPPPPKKDPYADAKKKDPNLDKHIAERDKHKKGTPEYNAAQNRINKAYGDKTRHGVTKSKGTKGRDTISRLNVPGIVDKAKLERKRKIGGTKIIQQNVNLQTGEHKERKTKGDKQKERFYDAGGNLRKISRKILLKLNTLLLRLKLIKELVKLRLKLEEDVVKKLENFSKV